MALARSVITIRETRLLPAGDDYNLEVFVSLTRDSQPLSNENLTIYVNRRAWGPFLTDKFGRIAVLLEGLRANHCLVGKQIEVEVCFEDADGTSFQSSLQTLSTDKASTAVDPTKAAKSAPPQVTTLKTILFASVPVGDQMRHTVLISSLDQRGNLIAGGKCVWALAQTSPSNGEAQLTTGRDTVIAEVSEDAFFNAVLTDHAVDAAQPLALPGPPKEKEAKPASKLTKPSFSGKVDTSNAETIVYTVTFNALNEDGNGVAGAEVNRMFDGSATIITANSKGLCTDSDVRVKGFDAKLTYEVTIPGTNASQSVELSGPKKPAEKPPEDNKRLQFKMPDGCLKSQTNNFDIPPIRTASKDGKAETAELIFTAPKEFTLVDKTTNKPLRHNSKRAVNTKYFVYKTPTTGLALLECQIAGSDCKLNILHVDAHEEASVAMEFEY